MKIKRAIISVSRKEGIVDFATFLEDRRVEILSTGGTAAELKKKGISVKDISEYTGFPEIMDGRVKTLHPKVHGGILNIRNKTEHQEAKKSHGISDIDLVVVNLYPFKETISKPGVDFEEAIENIDIGGPSMIRAAAKNFSYVTVIVDPKDYPKVMEDINKNKGKTSDAMRFHLAKKVFFHTMEYDRMIYEYLAANNPF